MFFFETLKKLSFTLCGLLQRGVLKLRIGFVCGVLEKLLLYLVSSRSVEMLIDDDLYIAMMKTFYSVEIICYIASHVVPVFITMSANDIDRFDRAWKPDSGISIENKIKMVVGPGQAIIRFGHTNNY